MSNEFTQFYAPLLKGWGKAQGLRPICENIARQLVAVFHVHHIELIVAHQAHWKTLLQYNNASGNQFFYPPKALTDNKTPFYQLNKATRNNTPYLLQLIDTKRLFLPLERHNHIIGCLICDVPFGFQLDLDGFRPLTTLLSTELDSSLMSDNIQKAYSHRQTAEHQLKKTQDSQEKLQTALQALHDISFLLWRTKTLDRILFNAVDQGKKLLNIDRMAIFLFGGEKEICGTYGTDIQGNTTDERDFRSHLHDHWFTSKTLINKDYLVVQENCDLFQDCEVIGHGWSAYVALWEEDTPIGWIACDNLISGADFEPHHYDILKQFAFIVSQHIVRSRAEESLRQLNRELEQRVQSRTLELKSLNAQLEKLSRTDPLTGIANRRVFDEAFQREWQRAQLHQLPLSLLLIDVDFFKKYNDHYGHASGDQCLRAIAQTLNTLDNGINQLVARFGGEEFVLLASGCDQADCQALGNTIIHKIREQALPRGDLPQNLGRSVTISTGGSTCIPHLNDDAQRFFKWVDSALYQAKENGRNQMHFNAYLP